MKRTILAAVIGFIGISGLCPRAWAFHGMQGGTVSAQADPYSGGASFSVPIEVPPSRAGIQPGIQLRYSSSLPNGLLGVGWSLELGSIQRSTHKGVPSYTNSDEFVLIQSGSSQELVYDSTAGFYRARTEGAFMKTEFVDNTYWRMTDKKGTHYYFGEDQASREYDPAATTRVFKWALNRVEDVHGNSTTVSYFKADNRLYPEEILYTGNAQTALSPFARVLLNYATNPNQRVSFISGFQIKTTWRLSQINVYGGGALQRIYKLNYAQSAATDRSLIASIVHYASDQTSALPAQSFVYQDVKPAYYPVQPAQGSAARFTGDFNGDGLSDVALLTSSSGQVDVALSDGSSFGLPQNWSSNFGVNQNIFAGDFNADGRADIGSFDPSTGDWKVAYAAANSFADMGVWISGFGAAGQPGTGDFNGDGLTDLFSFYKSGDKLHAKIAVNKGGYFEPLDGFDVSIGTKDDIPLTIDFNGDGLTDLLSFDKANGRWFVYWNEGDLNGKFTLLQTITGFGTSYNPVIADFNADNLPDIGYFEPPTGNVFYRISDEFSFYGSSFVFSTGFNVQGADAQVQSVDFNGDGLADFAGHNPAGDKEVRFSSGTPLDILTSIANGVGAVTTITYQPSTQYINTYLPVSLPLVKSVQNSNGRGDVFETRYSYAGGYWDKTDREFRGFEVVTVTDPQDNYTQIRFLQDSIFKGRVVSEKQFDAAGNLLAEVQNTWKSQEIAGGVDFVYLYRKDNLVYDGNSSGRRTSEEYFYEETPQAGNLTRVEQYGEVDLITGQKNGIDNLQRRIKTEYINDMANWILGLPALTRVEDTYYQTMRKTMFYYDAKGLLIKKEDWAGPPAGEAGDTPGVVNPVTQYTYDAVGNLLTTTDPQGNITRVTYDTTYNMFPLTTENALGHKVINEYYGVNGVALDSGDGLQGLWGQLKSTTDPNQQQGRRSYDVFGRLVMTVGPKDSVSYPTQTTSIEYFSDYNKVTTRQRIKSGQAQTLDTVSFYDGFDRLIQTKMPSEVAGRFTVSGQAEYDSRGLKSKIYLPYFSTSPVDTIEPVDANRAHSRLEYDAMGRAVKTINADGTYASVAYDDWSTTTTDENGHRQKSYFDAYGRLIKKEEYLGADGRSPYYPAKPYTLYATTLYYYDSEGNLIQTRDAHNNTTTITYDVLGRKTAMDDPDMGHWTYAYDLNGNLVSQTDAKGQTLTFTYDALNRLTNKADGVGGTVNVSYTYDNASSTNSKGRLTQAQYTNGNTQFAYDALGRELQSIKQINATGYGVQRGYDVRNNLLQIQYPDQKNIYYKYNAAGQIEAISNDQTILPQSWNWDGEKTEELAFKSEILRQAQDPSRRNPEPRRGTNSNDQNANDKSTIVLNLENSNLGFVSNFVLHASNLSASVLAWLERTLLGVGEAEAQTTDLIGHWKFDEGSGTVANDSSGSGYTGSLISMGPTNWVAGKVNGALDFGGVDDYVSAGNPANWPITNTITLAAWVKIDRDIHGRIISKHGSSGNYGFLLTRNSTSDSVEWRISTSGSNWLGGMTSAGSFPIGQWYHIAATYDGAVMRVYFNGQENKGGNFPLNAQGAIKNSSQTLQIGRDGNMGNTYVMDGIIDDVRVYKRALTAAEVAELYNSGNVLPSAPVLNSAAAGDKQVTLSWSAVSGATGYKVYYGTSSGVYGTPVTLGNVTSSTVTALTNGMKYYFAVVAYNAAGQSVYSNELSAIPVAPPAAPVLNTAAAGDKQVALAWSAVSGAAGYKVYYSTISREYSTPINVGNMTTTTVMGLTNGTKYYFAVSATNAGGEGAKSNELNATPVAPAPTVTLTAGPAAITAGEFTTLTWSSTNADECLASGGWSGLKAVSGTANVTPSATTTYTLTCGGPGGTVSTSAEVTVNPLIVQESPTLFVKNVNYNAAGQMTKVDYGNGDVTEYTYDALTLRLTRIYTLDANRSTLQDLSYTYDSAGNILSITDNVNTASQTFKYDELNRLVEASNPSPGSYGTKTYVYDEIGNIVQKDGKTYFYGENGAGPHAVTSLSDGTAFTYDANGNLTQQTQPAQSTQYTYDAENRLVKVVKNGSTIAQYEYDGDGGRTKKTATVGGQTTATTFVGSLFEKTDVRTTKYVFLGGQRVAAITSSPALGSTTLYYHADHLGGANVLTDSTGFKKELIEYEPFGLESRHEKYGSSEEVAWYYFTGKPKDDETGLLFFGARYYDPSLGRFITADTIVPSPNDPQSLNRYSYARNNPVNVIDPTGHKWSWKKFWHAAVGAIVGVAATIVLGPAGLALVGTTMAGVIGGAVGGAITGGLEGGWKGALMGAAFGGALGGVGAWGVGNYGWQFGAGMLAAGAGVAAATDSWDSFAGGIVGGLAGWGIGKGITGAYKEQFSNYRARRSPWSEYQKQIDELYIQNKDKHNASALKVSRPLGKADGSPGSLTGPSHDLVILPDGTIKEMGPLDNGKIGINPWKTAITSDKALDLGGEYVRNVYADVNLEGLNKAISLYDKTIVHAQMNYNALDHNSNYAVDSWIRGGGGNVPKGYRDPGFPNLD